MRNPANGPQEDDVEAEIMGRTLREFESAVGNLAHPKHVFRLYVAGNSRRSRQAIKSIRGICERYLQDNYELDVVDVYQQPAVTQAANVIALPTLVREQPLPQKKFVGDMSDTERIVAGLQLRS